jgi:Domain of unknown function (DUF3854)
MSKYIYVSSPQGTIGCSATPRAHVPLHDPSRRNVTVRITEGVLKAEVATERSSLLTISMPGVAASARAVAVAQKLGARKVVLAVDADARRNPHVATALQRGVQLIAHEFGPENLGVEHWPETHKGIDDLLISSRAGDLVQCWGREALAWVIDTVNAASAKVDPIIPALVVVCDIADRLKADVDGTAFAPDVLEAAGVLRRTNKPGYERVARQMKKAGVRMREWEREVRKHGRSVPRRRNESREELPEVVVDVDEAAVTDTAIDALSARDDLFQRGGMLVHVVHDGGTLAGVTRPRGTPRIVTVPLALLREWCSASLRWMFPKTDDDGNPMLIEGHPPVWGVEAIHKRGQWPGIRSLEAVIEWPVLRPDGTVLSTPGYDTATGLLYAPNCDAPHVPDVPTAADAAKAVALLREVACDVPFATPAHEAAYMAAIVTPFARYAFYGPAPLMLIDKNVRGAGGTLLADVVGEAVCGRSMAKMSPTPHEEEERKRITSLALSGATLILVDNIAHTFGSPPLLAALTATEWTDRVLGASQMVRLPLAATWFATGNNIALSEDMARRCLHIRLESPEENPELRSSEGFKHPELVLWVRSQRPAIMAAALTILRAYVVAGRPDLGLSAWGSFEGWSRLVRSAIVWAGFADPGETRQQLQADSDTSTSALADLVTGWEEIAATLGGRCAVAEVLHVLEEDYEKKFFKTLRSALEELVPGRPGELPNARRIGNALKKFRGRVVGGKALVKAGDRGESGNVWMVQAVAPPSALGSLSGPRTVAPKPPAASAVAPASPGAFGEKGLVRESSRAPQLAREARAGSSQDTTDAAVAAAAGATTAGPSQDTAGAADAAGARRVRL